MYIQRLDTPLYVQKSALKINDKTELAKIERQIDDVKKLKDIHDKIEADSIKIDIDKSNLSAKIAMLDTKLRTGHELNDNELNFLRENSPQIYAKAMRIRQERRQYKSVLSLCRSKYDVDNMHLTKISGLSAEAIRIRNNTDISEEKKEEMLNEIECRTAALQDEYVKYTQTQKYKDLPLMPNGSNAVCENNAAIRAKSVLEELKKRNAEFLKAQITTRNELKNKRA